MRRGRLCILIKQIKILEVGDEAGITKIGTFLITLLVTW